MYNQKLIIESSELNTNGKEQIVQYIVKKFEQAEIKDIDSILAKYTLPTLSINDVIDIAGEVLLRAQNESLIQRGVANSKKLRAIDKKRIKTGHPSRCIDRTCIDCSGCILEESMPCLPTCEVLDPITGAIDPSYCIDNCEACVSDYVVIEIDEHGENDIYKGQVQACDYESAMKSAMEKYSLHESKTVVYRIK